MPMHVPHGGTLKKVATAHYPTASGWKAVKEAWRWTGSMWQKVYESFIPMLWPIDDFERDTLGPGWQKMPVGNYTLPVIVNGEATALGDQTGIAVYVSDRPSEYMEVQVVLGTTAGRTGRFMQLYSGVSLTADQRDTLAMITETQIAGLTLPRNLRKGDQLSFHRQPYTSAQDDTFVMLNGMVLDHTRGKSRTSQERPVFGFQVWATSPAIDKYSSRPAQEMTIPMGTYASGKSKASHSGWATPALDWYTTDGYPFTSRNVGTLYCTAGWVQIKLTAKMTNGKDVRISSKTGGVTTARKTTINTTSTTIEWEGRFTGPTEVWCDVNGYTGSSSDHFTLEVNPRRGPG